MKHSILWLGVAALFFGALACADPDRAILERLGASEAERFERGRSAASRCWVCHDLAGTVKKVGPSLLGVYGRRSGDAPNFSPSPAMKDAGIVWDDATLAAFLRDPAGVVPGNRMVYAGLRDENALSDLLFYLGHVTRPGARDAE